MTQKKPPNISQSVLGVEGGTKLPWFQVKKNVLLVIRKAMALSPVYVIHLEGRLDVLSISPCFCVPSVRQNSCTELM